MGATNYGTFQPDELMPLIPSLFVGGNFLSLAFFPGSFEFDTEFVHFDRVLDDKRMSGTLLVAVGGVLKTTGVAVNRGTGVVTLSPAPAAAAVITAGFAFDVPVRFDDDFLSVSWDTINSRSIGSIPLVEVRD